MPVVLLGWGASGWILLPCVLAPVAWTQTRRVYRETAPAQLIVLLGQSGRYVALYALLFAVGVMLDR